MSAARKPAVFASKCVRNNSKRDLREDLRVHLVPVFYLRYKGKLVTVLVFRDFSDVTRIKRQLPCQRRATIHKVSARWKFEDVSRYLCLTIQLQF